MKIGWITQRRSPAKQGSITPEVLRLLSEWGVDIDLIYPHEQLTELANIRIDHDLYILKARTPLTVSVAGVLHAIGAAILNPYPISTLMMNKVITTRVLQMAGVPSPETYMTHDLDQLASLLADGPLVIKPYQGSSGRGVQIVWRAEELNALSNHPDLIFAQRYYQPQDRDYKIYCIGGQLFGVKRIWPAQTYAEKLGQPFTLTSELRQIALCCGEAFGVDFYGLDVVMSGDRPYVVDISSFPGFKGVPEAGLRLADYIYTALQRVKRGEPLLSNRQPISINPKTYPKIHPL